MPRVERKHIEENNKSNEFMKTKLLVVKSDECKNKRMDYGLSLAPISPGHHRLLLAEIYKRFANFYRVIQAANNTLDEKLCRKRYYKIHQ